MSDIRNSKTVKIAWVDSCARGGWTHVDRLDKQEVAKIVSTGIVVRETKDEITISTSFSTNGSCMDPLTIPKRAILKITGRRKWNQKK